MDTYDDHERARIRAALVGYAENGLTYRSSLSACATPSTGRKTSALALKPLRDFWRGCVSDKTMAVCARFVKRLSNRSNPLHVLGQALAALYKSPLPPDIAGSYALTSGAMFQTRISVAAPSAGFAIIKEEHAEPIKRLHDGVLVSTAPGEYLILSRDRVMLSPRYIATKDKAALVYDHARSLYQAGHPAFNYAAVFTKEGS